MPSAVRLCVKDTGIGIAPEHRARLFDEFYQVANAERSPDRGVGLGFDRAPLCAQTGYAG